MTIRWKLSALGLLALGCGPPSAATLPEPDADVGLGDVVMLTWTTRAPEGILGHVLEPTPELRLDPHRKVIHGTPRWVENDQTLHVVVSTENTAELAAGQGMIAGSARGARATHVAYEVRVTGYLEFPPSELRYAISSGCCLGGSISPSCGEGYVVRLFRGTGTAEHLQKLSGSVHVSASEILRASGGTEFRKLSESKFTDTFFAYELVSLASLCANVAPDAEVEPLSVAARNNCYLSVISSDGKRSATSWNLPTQEVCQQVAQTQCTSAQGAILCQGRYGLDDNGKELALAPRSAQAAPATPGASTVPEHE